MRVESINKIRRPTAADYMGADFALSKGNVPTYEVFMADMKDQWEEYFRETEKRGITGDNIGPVNFRQYLSESMVVLLKQVGEVIPQKAAAGTLSREDAAAATELANTLIDYETRALASME